MDKQGIPLLEAFDETLEDDNSEQEFDEVIVQRKSSSWKRWMLLAIVTIIAIGIIVLLVVSLPFAFITHTNLDDVIKSPYDAREYSSFTLKNDLRVLVISDPQTKVSAASMDVAVGSFSDPQNYSGLAHFCEQ